MFDNIRHDYMIITVNGFCWITAFYDIEIGLVRPEVYLAVFRI